jgi:SAM-dependent methyltransferase
MHGSRELNLANWNERAAAHAASADYRVQKYIDDPSHIGPIVRFDMPRLGDIAGLSGVHLQCHIGTDTLSLARLGARMTGLDFSGAALAEARRLAQGAGADIRFVEAEVYDATTVLEPQSFDFVFTGIGALIWLPRVAEWATVVSGLLRPGGWLFIREGHPILWALAERTDGLLIVEHPYFETQEPTVWDDPGTYVQTEAVFQNTVTHEWNHGLGEIVTALMEAGLELTMLVEHDTVPWEALPGHMERIDEHEWRLIDRPERLPLTYTLRAVKAS